MRTIPRGNSSPGVQLSAEEQDLMRTLPRRAPTPSASGLAVGASPHQSTTLGVAPPPKPNVSARIAQQKAPKKASHVWLIVGALVFIGAGIALAFVLVG